MTMKLYWDDDLEEYETKDITFYLEVAGCCVATTFPYDWSARDIARQLAEALFRRPGPGPIRLDSEAVLNRTSRAGRRARAKYEWRDLIPFVHHN